MEKGMTKMTYLKICKNDLREIRNVTFVNKTERTNNTV